MQSTNDSDGTSNGVEPSRGHKGVVLVVEDAAVLRDLLRKGLEREGFEVLAVGSAKEGCEVVRRGGVDLVLLDWDLLEGRASLDESGLGGDVLAVCREVDESLPVIVMSGADEIDVRADALQGGADSFVNKPFHLGMLTRHIEFLLRRARQGAAIFRLASEDDILPLEEAKELYVRAVVRLLQGNVSEAARRLGVHRQTVAGYLGADRPREG